MNWAVHVARVEDVRTAHDLLVGKSEGKNHSKYKSIDDRIILKWILNKSDEGSGIVSFE